LSDVRCFVSSVRKLPVTADEPEYMYME